MVGGGSRVHNEELHNIIRMINWRRVGLAGHVACMGEMTNSYKILRNNQQHKQDRARGGNPQATVIFLEALCRKCHESGNVRSTGKFDKQKVIDRWIMIGACSVHVSWDDDWLVDWFIAWLVGMTTQLHKSKLKLTEHEFYSNISFISTWDVL
jgi:hypothetical protein